MNFFKCLGVQESFIYHGINQVDIIFSLKDIIIPNNC